MTETADDQRLTGIQDDEVPADDLCQTNENTESSLPDSNIPATDLTTDASSITSKSSEAALKDTSKPPGASSRPSPAINQTDQQPKLSLEQQLSKAKRDLESMVLKYARSESENLQNKAKSEELDRKLKRAIKDNDSLANRIKILTNDKNQLSDTLSAKVAQLTVLEQKNNSLSSVQSVKLKELESEVEQLRKVNEDLLKSIDTYKSKENELLDFSERLSMKQLLLQAELDKALEDAPDYKKQYDLLVIENGDLRQKVDELTEQCRLSSESLIEEKKLVEKLRSDQSELELRCRRNVEELENEMKVLKRKHQVATKELLKQLKCLQVALDKMNNTQNGNKIIT